MVQKNSLKKVIVITGPTGVGKTNLAIKISKHFNAEIINADASQMRKRLNIGTAKISIDEMQNVPHHLIDFLEPTESFSIKDYVDRARIIIDGMENIPVIVGGSGLYIQALISTYNLNFQPRKNDSEFDELSNEEVYAILQSIDNEAALKVHYNNRKRVIRYIELAREKNEVEPIEPMPYYDALVIGLTKDRFQLYEAINNRCDKMIKNGWLEEVKSLANDGINMELIKEIGYDDLYKVTKNELTLDKAVNDIKQKTRNYAKRQLTWFRNKMNCEFFEINNSTPEMAIERIKKFLYNK